MGQKDVNLKTCPNCGIGEAAEGSLRCPICNCSYDLQTVDLYEYCRCYGTFLGKVSGHPLLPDGSDIRTSVVLKETEKFILTYNTLYMLRLGTFPTFLQIKSEDQVKEGMQVRYVGTSKEFYTYGNVYSVKSIKFAGISIPDDTPLKNHWWSMPNLGLCFEIVLPTPPVHPLLDYHETGKYDAGSGD